MNRDRHNTHAKGENAMVTGKEVRMQRIWKHRRAVLVPFDHGGFSGPQPGIEHMLRLTERLSRTRADGILVAAGMIQHIAAAVGQLAILARLDGGFTKFADAPADYEQLWSVRDALTLGADAAIVFTFVGTPMEGVSMRRLGAAAAEAHAAGVPLVSEIIPPSLLNNHFGMNVFPRAPKNVQIHDEIRQTIRIGAECGADIIKTRYGGNIGKFKQAVESCTAKVIVAGGPLTSGSDEALLQLAYDCVQAEADGIIFGRTVWQHPRMEKILAALCAVVHEEETVAQARKLLR